jgi:hypothetical protein
MMLQSDQIALGAAEMTREWDWGVRKYSGLLSGMWLNVTYCGGVNHSV